MPRIPGLAPGQITGLQEHRQLSRLLSLLVLFSLPSWAITLVETQWYSAHGRSIGASCTGGVITLNWGTPTTSGELIYALALEGESNRIGSVSDSASQAYTAGNSLPGNGHYTVKSFYVTGSNAGITSLAFTSASGSGDGCGTMLFWAGHWTGVATHDIAANFGSAQSCSAFNSSPATTTNANDLLLGMAAQYLGSGNWGMGTGWTLESPATNASFAEAGDGNSIAIEQQLASSIGGYSAAFILSASGKGCYAAFDSFKAASLPQ